jgi:hypothetical protein
MIECKKCQIEAKVSCDLLIELIEKFNQPIDTTKAKLSKINKINGLINAKRISPQLLNVITANDKTNMMHKGGKKKSNASRNDVVIFKDKIGEKDQKYISQIIRRTKR